MTIETKTLTVSGIKVEVVRKDIKNLHLGVYPPAWAGAGGGAAGGQR